MACNMELLDARTARYGRPCLDCTSHIKVTAIHKFANLCSQSPVYTLVDTPGTPNLQSRSYLANDPALIVLYKQLREKTLQTLKGASKIPPRVEWEFVIQNARLYDRMGCDILALDLGTYFLTPQKFIPAHQLNYVLILLLSPKTNSPKLGIPHPTPRPTTTTNLSQTTPPHPETKPPRPPTKDAQAQKQSRSGRSAQPWVRYSCPANDARLALAPRKSI